MNGRKEKNGYKKWKRKNKQFPSKNFTMLYGKCVFTLSYFL